jgi:hypothetical protein
MEPPDLGGSANQQHLHVMVFYRECGACDSQSEVGAGELAMVLARCGVIGARRVCIIREQPEIDAPPVNDDLREPLAALPVHALVGRAGNIRRSTPKFPAIPHVLSVGGYSEVFAPAVAPVSVSMIAQNLGVAQSKHRPMKSFS